MSIDMVIEIDRLKELIIKFKDTRQKVIIIGGPESVKKVENVINAHKEEFYDYRFSYDSDPSFEEGQIYMLSEKDINPDGLKFMHYLEEE